MHGCFHSELIAVVCSDPVSPTHTTDSHNMAMMRGCVVAALVQLCASFAPTAQLHHMASPGRRCTHRDRAVTMATPEERLAALEEAMKALKVESAASPAERLAELEQGIAQLRKDMTADTLTHLRRLHRPRCQ